MVRFCKKNEKTTRKVCKKYKGGKYKKGQGKGRKCTKKVNRKVCKKRGGKKFKVLWD